MSITGLITTPHSVTKHKKLHRTVWLGVLKFQPDIRHRSDIKKLSLSIHQNGEFHNQLQTAHRNRQQDAGGLACDIYVVNETTMIWPGLIELTFDYSTALENIFVGLRHVDC